MNIAHRTSTICDVLQSYCALCVYFFFDVQLIEQVLNVRDISEVLSELEEQEEPKEEEVNTGFNKYVDSFDV